MPSEGLSGCTDGELIGMIRAGGKIREAAWTDMLRRYTPKMYAVARSFDIDQQTAEDLVQTAWLRFLERSHQLRDESSVGAWLCMIVRNEARRLVTRRRTIPTAEGWDQRPADIQSPAAGLVASEQAKALRSAFAKLGEDCRQLLTLVLADPPLSYDEIAVALDRPRGSLGPTRQRCLDHLRRLLPAGLEITE
ncbi:MAG: sigma-70 family RNA polymerase sigma factor [Ilumatobacteraceae bacterium]|nr:sigma-70 family RNA polymerase sigma factor [Ilumatobacteraceae bacterium]